MQPVEASALVVVNVMAVPALAMMGCGASKVGASPVSIVPLPPTEIPIPAGP